MIDSMILSFTANSLEVATRSKPRPSFPERTWVGVSQTLKLEPWSDVMLKYSPELPSKKRNFSEGPASILELFSKSKWIYFEGGGEASMENREAKKRERTKTKFLIEFIFRPALSYMKKGAVHPAFFLEAT